MQNPFGNGNNDNNDDQNQNLLPIPPNFATVVNKKTVKSELPRLASHGQPSGSASWYRYFDLTGTISYA